MKMGPSLLDLFLLETLIFMFMYVQVIMWIRVNYLMLSKKF